MIMSSLLVCRRHQIFLILIQLRKDVSQAAGGNFNTVRMNEDIFLIKDYEIEE